jgi:hypothetical protein
MTDVFSEMVKKDTRDWIKEMIQYCSDKKITPNISNFLKADTDSGIPKSIYLIFGNKNHKFYFFNSKKFISFYKNLPPDFKNDIASFEEIRKIQLLTASSDELDKFFNKILKKDYIWYK